MLHKAFLAFWVAGGVCVEHKRRHVYGAVLDGVECGRVHTPPCCRVNSEPQLICNG